MPLRSFDVIVRPFARPASGKDATLVAPLTL